MEMSRAFSMFVKDVAPLPRRPGTLVLAGPTVGIAPEAGQRLVVRGAFGAAETARYLGAEMLHPQKDAGDAGMIVSGLPRTPRAYLGAIVHEEGVWCRTFGALLREATRPRVEAARFDLKDGRAFGLLKVEDHVVTAVVIGGGLPEEGNLWRELIRIVTPGGTTLAAAEFEPIGLGFGWPVAAWAGYTREGGAQTVLLTRPCGPAAPGTPTIAFYDGYAQRAQVLSQQQQGLVQIDVGVPMKQARALVMADAA
jgi:hypothetical protein